MRKIIIPPVFVFISIIAIVLFYFKASTYNFIEFPFNLIGIGIMLLGFYMMGKARELFKKHKTTLMIQQSSSVVTEGVYSKTRNPMYIGMFLMLLGTGICFMNLFSLLVPFIFILLIRIIFIPTEERLMNETFGKEYRDYKNKVGRWI